MPATGHRSGLRATALVVCVTMASATLQLSTARAAGTTTASCTSSISNTVLTGGLDIPSGAICDLTDVAVMGAGGVDVEGTLIANNTAFGGAIVGRPGSSTQVHGGSTGGALTVEGPGSSIVLDGAAEIGGSATITGPGYLARSPAR